MSEARWVSFKEKKPLYGQEIFAYRVSQFSEKCEGVYKVARVHLDREFILILDKGFYTIHFDFYRPIEEFSHWMLIPEVPK